MPRLHPNLAELYRQKVINLADALNDEHTRLEAAECIRELIEEIRLVPAKGKLRVELYGELAALLNLANEHPRSMETGVQVTLVAGWDLFKNVPGSSCESRFEDWLRGLEATYTERGSTTTEKPGNRSKSGTRNQRYLHLDHAIL